MVGDNYLNKKKALHTEILPYGVRVVQDKNSWDEFSLYYKKKAFSIAVHSVKRRQLGIVPLFSLYSSKMNVSRQGGVVVLSPKGVATKNRPSYVALWSGSAFSFSPIKYKNNDKVFRFAGLSGSTIKLLFKTKTRVRDFRLTIAYGFTKEDAIKNVRRLMSGNGNTGTMSFSWWNFRTMKNRKGYAHCMLRFLENHDEQRIASRFFANDAWTAVPAMTVSATMSSSPVMLYYVGEPAAGKMGFSGDDGRTTIFDY